MEAARLGGGRPDSAQHNGISLVGNPNVGKSVLFGALSGRYAAVSNYPGTTVELARGTLRVGGRRWPLVDTPGANSLVPQSEDERVTRDLLLSGPTTVLQVADAKNLVRGLALTIELAEAGLPSVLCLNMADEADELGVRIDTAGLARRLGIDVVRTVATRREGISRLAPALAEARVATIAVDYGETIEAAIHRIAALLPTGPVAPRALAVAILGGDATLGDWLARRLDPEALLKIRTIVAGAAAVNGAVLDRIQRRRLAAAGAIARAVTRDRGRAAGWARIGALTMHPLWGLPALALALGGLYLFVGVFGAQMAVGWFEHLLFGRVVNPAVTGLVARLPLPDLARDFIAGPYGLVTMGLTYAIAIVLPIVTTFFLAFSVLEDSGYLPRLAVMLNRVFRVMGLNGRAVLPMILGLGCDTMATLTTRILGTRRERLVVVLLLALGVPCSAQLGVILGMLAGLSWRASWCSWGGSRRGSSRGLDPTSSWRSRRCAGPSRQTSRARRWRASSGTSRKRCRSSCSAPPACSWPIASDSSARSSGWRSRWSRGVSGCRRRRRRRSSSASCGATSAPPACTAWRSRARSIRCRSSSPWSR